PARERTPPPRDPSLVRRLLRDRLHPRVDHPAADGGVLRPRGDQAPAEHPELALRRLGVGVVAGRGRTLQHGVHGLGRGDGVVGPERLVDPFAAGTGDLELLDEVLRLPARRVATTHTVSVERSPDRTARPRGKAPAGGTGVRRARAAWLLSRSPGRGTARRAGWTPGRPPGAGSRPRCVRRRARAPPPRAGCGART